MGPNPMTGVLIRRGKFGHGHTEKTPREDGGRGWSDATARQRRSRITGNLSGSKRGME